MPFLDISIFLMSIYYVVSDNRFNNSFNCCTKVGFGMTDNKKLFLVVSETSINGYPYFDTIKKYVELTPDLEQKIKLDARKESGVVEEPFNPVKWLKCQDLTIQKLKEALK